MSKVRCGLTLTTVLAVAIGAAGCQPAASARAVPVATDRVATGDTPITRTGPGQVRAFNTAVARAQVGGQLVKVEFVEGQPVKQGDPLAQIDPRPFEAVVAQDEATIARDMITLGNAEAELERYLRVGTGLISQPQLEMQRNQVAQLKATVAADEAAARRDRLQVEFASVRSPISGVTGLRLIDVGNLVGPADPQGLVTISQIQPITTLFTLPRSDLPAIRAAMLSAGETGLEVEIYPQGDASRPLDVGRLALIDNHVNLGSGTITLKATSPNALKQLWPGEAVDARLVLARRTDGLTVPSSAVRRGADGAYAWVVNPDRTIVRRAIRVGDTLGPRTVVASGLKAGEEVVADGQAALTPGGRITRVSHAPTRTAARPAARSAARPVNWLEP